MTEGQACKDVGTCGHVRTTHRSARDCRMCWNIHLRDPCWKRSHVCRMRMQGHWSSTYAVQPWAGGKYRVDGVHDLAVGSSTSTLLHLAVIQIQQVVEPGQELILAHEERGIHHTDRRHGCVSCEFMPHRVLGLLKIDVVEIQISYTRQGPALASSAFDHYIWPGFRECGRYSSHSHC